MRAAPGKRHSESEARAGKALAPAQLRPGSSESCRAIDTDPEELHTRPPRIRAGSPPAVAIRQNKNTIEICRAPQIPCKLPFSDPARRQNRAPVPGGRNDVAQRAAGGRGESRAKPAEIRTGSPGNRRQIGAIRGEKGAMNHAGEALAENRREKPIKRGSGGLFFRISRKNPKNSEKSCTISANCIATAGKK